jgi:hypothetical protein
MPKIFYVDLFGMLAKKKMKVKMYVSIICPECGFVMWLNEDDTIKCMHNKCKLKNKLFNLPSIEIKPYNKTLNPTQTQAHVSGSGK